MITKIQIVIVEELNGTVKHKNTYEFTKSQLSQKRLKELKAQLLKVVGIEEGA